MLLQECAPLPHRPRQRRRCHLLHTAPASLGQGGTRQGLPPVSWITRCASRCPLLTLWGWSSVSRTESGIARRDASLPVRPGPGHMELGWLDDSVRVRVDAEVAQCSLLSRTVLTVESLVDGATHVRFARARMSLLANGHIEASRRLHIHLNENGHSARATILQTRA